MSSSVKSVLPAGQRRPAHRGLIGGLMAMAAVASTTPAQAQPAPAQPRAACPADNFPQPTGTKYIWAACGMERLLGVIRDNQSSPSWRSEAEDVVGGQLMSADPKVLSNGREALAAFSIAALDTNQDVSVRAANWLKQMANGPDPIRKVLSQNADVLLYPYKESSNDTTISIIGQTIQATGNQSVIAQAGKVRPQTMQNRFADPLRRLYGMPPFGNQPHP